MIHADSHPGKYLTEFTNGAHFSTADSTADKGGANLGFRPHELLEAALASCMNMSLRMYADKYDMALSGVSVAVSLNRSTSEQPTFEYSVEFHGSLSEQQQEQLLSVLDSCPVRTTLSKPLQFRLTPRPGAEPLGVVGHSDGTNPRHNDG